jgi:predicted pyridoxine 5'-phosphate oxidase superfamily flavin-nucleotide-binding protein
MRGIVRDHARSCTLYRGADEHFLATASAKGQPYIQHRGGPLGFLKVLDGKTLGLADFVGNRQYITQGTLMDNPKAHPFLIDYTRRQRIKIWGEARIVEDKTELIARLTPEATGHAPNS